MDKQRILYALFASTSRSHRYRRCDRKRPQLGDTRGCKPYGPHLHFEIHSGDWSKGYAALKTSIINPLCDDIQTFCGGCSYDVNQCQNKKGSNEWEKLGDEAKAEKSAATGKGQMQPDPSSDTGYTGGASSGYAAVTGCGLEQFLPKGDECWFCPLFTAIFNTSSKIALKSYMALADGIANLVLVCFALWTAIFVLKHVTAVEVKNPSKMIQEYLLQAFKVLLVVLILKGSYFQVMHYSLEPVFNTGMQFSQTITGTGNNCASEISSKIVGYDSEFTGNSAGGLLGTLTMVDYYGIGVLTVFIFYFFRGRKWWCLLGQIAALYCQFIFIFCFN